MAAARMVAACEQGVEAQMDWGRDRQVREVMLRGGRLCMGGGLGGSKAQKPVSAGACNGLRCAPGMQAEPLLASSCCRRPPPPLPPPLPPPRPPAFRTALSKLAILPQATHSAKIKIICTNKR